VHKTTIKLRALTSQIELIDRASAVLAKRRTDFIMEAAWERAQSVLVNQGVLDPNPAKLNQVNEMLENTPEPNAGLECLKSIRAPWLDR